ncbi:MAG: LysM peptidoglycan-binding domain-containing protein [Opitutaceae bacterium]|nr:LysM peptidoglycan-binding domain-containing protein [Opitutaceae bacterium]
MKKRLRLFRPAGLAVLAWLGGCARDASLPLTSELDEPNYRQGQQLGRQGRPQEALAAFLKVIARRNEDAPESHLEAGLIYSQHIKDPIAAIYHFRKYLELEPNSRQAELVRQRIDAAKRDFARTLPGQQYENGADRLIVQEQIGRLQRENDELKAELAALHGGTAPPAMRWRPAAATAEEDSPMVRPPVNVSQSVADSPIMLAPLNPKSVARPPAGQSPPPAKAGAARPTAAKPAVAGRRHMVQPGDSLYKIAQHYYGVGGASTRAHAIFQANRDVMKSETDLKPGMELKIP